MFLIKVCGTLCQGSAREIDRIAVLAKDLATVLGIVLAIGDESGDVGLESWDRIRCVSEQGGGWVSFFYIPKKVVKQALIWNGGGKNQKYIIPVVLE